MTARRGGASTYLATWWWLAGLCVVSVFNIGLWVWMRSGRPRDDPEAVAHLVLSGVYTFVCAFRSFFPRVDLERRCIWDTWLSSIALGRATATVAEVCLGVQCQLFVLMLARTTGVEWLVWLAWPIAPLAVVSQLFCWHAMLTLNHLGHAIEELLWTALVGCVGVAFLVARSRVDDELSFALTLGVALCAGAACLTALVDVPMYIGRWRRGRAAGERYLSLRAGVRDAALRRVPTQAWPLWRQEVPWMTLYFSVGVWASLAMAWLATR